MSLILDALKRAERERQAERSAALDDLPASAAPRPRRRRGRWLALGLLAAVVGAVALGVGRRPKPAAQVAGKPAPAAAHPAPQAPPAQVPAPAATPAPAPAQPPIQARPAPSVLPGTEGVATLDDLTPESDVELVPAAPAAPPAATASTPPPELTAEPEPAPAEAESQEEPEAAAAPPQPATAAPPASRPVPPALTQKAPVRKLREMPPDYRADFPALTVEVHVFEPGRRFVMINGRRYREGERLAEGPQILEIVRDGIVMDYRGERVLLPIGR